MVYASSKPAESNHRSVRRSASYERKSRFSSRSTGRKPKTGRVQALRQVYGAETAKQAVKKIDNYNKSYVQTKAAKLKREINDLKRKLQKCDR